MKYKIMFSDWEGELNFEEIPVVFEVKKPESATYEIHKQIQNKYFLISKKEAKRFMNNCPLISVNEKE